MINKGPAFDEQHKRTRKGQTYKKIKKKGKQNQLKCDTRTRTSTQMTRGYFTYHDDDVQR